MIKYLSEPQLRTHLQIGKPVEQWISHSEVEDYIILKWLRIDKDKSGKYNVCYFESFDEGGLDFLEVYAFSAVDPDEPYGIITSLASIEDALDFAVRVYNATNDKFVPAGMIQEEYEVYLKNKES